MNVKLRAVCWYSRGGRCTLNDRAEGRVLYKELVQLKRNDILNLQIDDAIEVARVSERKIEIQGEVLKLRKDDRRGRPDRFERLNCASKLVDGLLYKSCVLALRKSRLFSGVMAGLM